MDNMGVLPLVPPSRGYIFDNEIKAPNNSDGQSYTNLHNN